MPLRATDIESAQVLRNATVLYTDGRYPAAAVSLADAAVARGLPIFFDLEGEREATDHLLRLSTYVVTHAEELERWYSGPLGDQAHALLADYPNIRLLCITLGADGALAVVSTPEDHATKRSCYHDLSMVMHSPACDISHLCNLLREFSLPGGHHAVYCPALHVPAEEVRDTTGAGDAFCAGVLRSLVAKDSVRDMLVAATALAAERIRS